MSQKSKKIIWAVDAFTEDKTLHKKAATVLKAWVHESPISIEPVFIMSPDQLNIPESVFPAIKVETETEARKRLAALSSDSGISQLLSPTLLVSASFSLRNAVHTLLDYAKQTGADLIAVSTQSKKGATRFFFGSFAETLVLQSEIPVLMVSPKTSQISQIKHVLYATDLTEASREAYQQILDLAER